ncbi:MAG TPA: PRC-barrel domain-containing protein [Thermoanaerobaculia bacterium]
MAHRTDDLHHTHPAGTATMEHSGVVPLKQLKDYTVAKGDPDVRGWNVYSNDGRKIGEVDELLVDTAAMRVRYLDVDLDRDTLAATGQNAGAAGSPGARPGHVLIPIGSAQLDEKDDRVMVDLLATLVGGLPAYDHGPVSREYETSVRQRFDRDYQHHPDRDRDFYNHDLYNDERFYGPRRRR